MWQIILCAILVLLCVLLFTPIRLQAAYDQGEISAEAGFGPVKIPLYPREEAAEKKTTKKKNGKKSDAAEKSTGEKKKRKINKEQIFYTLEKLPPILGKALKRLGQRICVCPLKLHLLVAGRDPADVALLYGRLNAALEGALPTLHRILDIREQDIQLFPDFQQEEMDCIAHVGVAIRLWDVLVIGVCAGASILQWLIGFRKLAETPSEETAQQKEQPAARSSGAA